VSGTEKAQGPAAGERQDLEHGEFIRHRMYAEGGSGMRKYAELVVGRYSLPLLLRYELLTTFLGPLPGALGLALRKTFFPTLFKGAGKGVIFGRSLVVRNGQHVTLGNRVVVDDYARLDGRGAGEEGVVVGDDVMVNRGVTLLAKVGPIHIGAGTSVGQNSVIISQGGVFIGKDVRIAGGCQISGGEFVTAQGPGADPHGKFTRGPVRIDDGCRLGMGAIVLDGVHIGAGAIIGAGAVISQDVPAMAVALGNPARVVAKREAAAP